MVMEAIFELRYLKNHCIKSPENLAVNINPFSEQTCKVWSSGETIDFSSKSFERCISFVRSTEVAQIFVSKALDTKVCKTNAFAGG